jgi:uncharacterized peroxidase-related enzyme
VRVPNWFERVEPDPNAPEDVRARNDAVAERTGFLPNIFGALSWRPAEYRAFFGYHDALMEAPGSLTKAERELIVVATSAGNHCLYCVVAHGAILRIRSKNPTIADQVSVDPERSDLTERERRILRFAFKVGDDANAIGPEDMAPLNEVGLGDEEIWLIGAITAFFALSNRLAGFAKILPNPEFYAMGRSPRQA